MNRYLTTAAGALLFAACAPADNDMTDSATLADSPAAAAPTGGDPSATATVRDSAGRDLGTLTLSETTGGIAISGTLNGLTPGEHAMHIHMVGRCDTPTFESAGEHWNPTNKQHGTDNPQGPHLGDLPNVTVGADSSVHVQAVTSGGTLSGMMNMLLDTDGAALVIHASPDDNRTDPSGGSGGRIACGAVTG